MKASFAHTLLIAPFALSHINDPCVDNNGIFELPNDLGGFTSCEFAHFNPSACQANVYKENCPSTCNTCCTDNGELFDISDNFFERLQSCDMISTKPHLCASEVIAHNCPKACGLCPCRDEGGRFLNNEERLVSCSQAARLEIKCRNDLFQTHCPATCNRCPAPPSSCNIVAGIKFPDPAATEYYGYNNNVVTVTKDGEDEICQWNNQVTSWGCTHEGDAYIFKTGPDYYDYNMTETVIVNNAEGGTFNFHLQHYFNSTLESYYEGDPSIQGVLSIKSTNSQVNKFSHPENRNQGNTPNGSIMVTVVCDDECDCNSSHQIIH